MTERNMQIRLLIEQAQHIDFCRGLEIAITALLNDNDTFDLFNANFTFLSQGID